MHLATRRLTDSIPGKGAISLSATAVVAMYAAALILLVVKPVAGVVLLAVVAAPFVAFGYPLAIAVTCVGMLWINGPLADFFPSSQYTAWKDALLVLLIGAWILRSAMLRRPVLLDHPISRPLLLLIITFVACCVLSPSATHAILGLKATVFYASWYFILPDIIRTRKDARALIAALLLGTLCLAAYNLWAVQQPWGAFPAGRDGRVLPGALIVHWGPSSVILPVGIIFGMVIAPRLRMWRRLIIEGVVIIGMVGLVVTTARAGWGLLLATTIFLGILTRRAAFGRIVVIALVAGIAIQTLLSVKVTERAASAFEGNDVSAESREAEFSTVTLPFVLSHPFGAGTGSMSAKGSAKVWAAGSDVDLVLQSGVIHNGFLLVAIETGWLGLAMYVWLLFAAMRSAWNSYVAARDPLVRDLALGCFGTVFFFTGMNFFGPLLTVAMISFDIWIIFGLISLLPSLDIPAPEVSV